jgi:hypothetical protein
LRGKIPGIGEADGPARPGKESNMRRLTITIALALTAAACGGAETSGSSGTTTAGGGGAGGETITVSGLGGDGGETAGTTSSTTGPCVVLGAVECGPEDPTAYPDDSMSYAPGAAFVGFINPAPETAEVGQGAAVVRLGPWGADRAVDAVSVIVGPVVADPVRLAIWTEPLCGLPQDDPNDHAVAVPLADLQQEPFGNGVKLTWTVGLDAPAGAPVFAARLMTNTADSIAVFEPVGQYAPRAMWWGVVDDDCDGFADDALGAAYLDTPTAPQVRPFHYDEGFEVSFAP